MRNNNFCSLIIIILLIIIPVSNGDCQSHKNVDKGTRTIYLIRHGFYNESDSRDEFIGKELTPLGIAQARLVAARLKGMPVKFTSLVSSTMTRARQTAIVINEDFPELNLRQDELISECTPPSWRKDVMAGVDTTEKEKCAENLENAFKKYFIPSPDSSGSNDIIVCHGNVIRYFVTKVLKVDTMSWLQMSIANCSLTTVKIKPDGSMKLVSFNDVGHIPLNLQTETGGNNKIKELIIH
jgi:serine/threonine-protein phosphatase PGAM5